MAKTEAVCLRISEKDKEWVENLAEEFDVEASEIVRRLIHFFQLLEHLGLDKILTKKGNRLT